MNTPGDETAALRSFLLGRLSEPEQTRLEEELLTDDETFNSLVAVEDDLIDDYVRGELTAAEARLFEQRFLCSEERRARVEFARTLSEHLGAETGQRVPSERTGLPGEWGLRLAVAASLLLAIAAGVLATRASLLSGRVAELELDRRHLATSLDEIGRRQDALQQDLEQRRAREQELGDDLAARIGQITQLEERIRTLATAAAQAVRQPVAVDFLLGLGSRGPAGPPRLLIPEQAEKVRLQVDLEGEQRFDSFRARLQTEAGVQVWGSDNLAATISDWGRSVELVIPAPVLEPGAHVLFLEGTATALPPEEIGVYDFEVVR